MKRLLKQGAKIWYFSTLNTSTFHNLLSRLTIELSCGDIIPSTQLSTVSFSNFDFLSSDRKPEIGNFTEDEENIGVTVPVSGVPSLMRGSDLLESGFWDPRSDPTKISSTARFQIISCSIFRQTPSYCQFAIEK